MTLVEQLIEAAANCADAHAKIFNQFSNDRHCDDVPGGEAWRVSLMRSQCRDGVPPSSQGVD